MMEYYSLNKIMWFIAFLNIHLVLAVCVLRVYINIPMLPSFILLLQVVLIDSDALLDTLENYLRKHR